MVMTPQPVLVQHEAEREVPQDLFDICDMQCPPSFRMAQRLGLGRTKAGRDPSVGRRMDEGSRCFENPYRQSINISSLARLGTACEPNATQTQGKGNGPRSPSLECCNDARC